MLILKSVSVTKAIINDHDVKRVYSDKNTPRMKLIFHTRQHYAILAFVIINEKSWAQIESSVYSVISTD